MKNRLIEMLALALLGLTTLAGIFTLPQAALLPEAWQPYLMLAGGLVLCGKNALYLVLDFCDDGKLNKSYDVSKVKVLLLGGLCLALMPSCVNGMPLGLDKAAWGEVGKAVGMGALKGGAQAGLEEWGKQRAGALEVTATK